LKTGIPAIVVGRTVATEPQHGPSPILTVRLVPEFLLLHCQCTIKMPNQDVFALNRDEWAQLLKKARTHQGLSSQ